MPRLSIVIPVYNAQKYLERSLASIYMSSFKDFEVIIVNDGSTDNTAEIINNFPINTLINFNTNKGLAAARNEGANKATGEIILFIDSDIVLKGDTLSKISAHFQDDQCQCVIGLYSKTHPNPDVFSNYKNMWIRFTYLTSPEYVNWFFTAIGAIRKDVWDKSGYFDPKFNIKTGGSDIDFGFRLYSQGIKILLDKNIDVIHLKKFNLVSLVKNDFLRSFGYIKLALNYNQSLADIAKSGIANAQNSFAISTILAGIISGIIILCPFSIWFVFMSVFFIFLYVKLNYPFYKYTIKELSFWKTILFIPVMFLDNLVCGIGVICSLINKYMKDLDRLIGD